MKQFVHLAATLALSGCALLAQTITSPGVNQDLGAGWRKSTVTKLDVDGNNVLGTDYYFVPKYQNQPTVISMPLPPYLLSAATAPGVGTFNSAASYFKIDDPTTTPGGAPTLLTTGNINIGVAENVSAELFRFSLTGNVPSRIRIAIMVDNYDLAAFTANSIQVSRTDVPVAGPVVATTSAAFKNNTPDWIYFDITGAAAGQSYSIFGTGGARGQAGLGAIAVDSQPPASDAYQVRYSSNLMTGDSVVNITNTGASSTAAFAGDSLAQNGNLCVNVYAFTPDEQLAACCSCFVTPNGLNSLSVRSDLASNPLTPVVPSSMVIKLIATAGGTTGASCNPGTVRATDLRPGMVAWGTTIHELPATAGTPATTFGVVETRFAIRPLSDTELNRTANLCSFIRANGSGYGLCKSCRLGGLGASAK